MTARPTTVCNYRGCLYLFVIARSAHQDIGSKTDFLDSGQFLAEILLLDRRLLERWLAGGGAARRGLSGATKRSLPLHPWLHHARQVRSGLRMQRRREDMCADNEGGQTQGMSGDETGTEVIKQDGWPERFMIIIQNVSIALSICVTFSQLSLQKIFRSSLEPKFMAAL